MTNRYFKDLVDIFISDHTFIEATSTSTFLIFHLINVDDIILKHFYRYKCLDHRAKVSRGMRAQIDFYECQFGFKLLSNCKY